jgi:dethiobiotin synthetase
MKVFIAGTDTDVGKTLVSSWLCLHTGAAYFKPIQTGASEGTDRQMVERLSGTRTYKEKFLFQRPISPCAAAFYEGRSIDLQSIRLPKTDHLIVEGAGGVMVPLNETMLMIDLIQHLKLPLVLVASGRLGTINHSLLSLEALRLRSIEILGIIISGDCDRTVDEAIARFGGVEILAHLATLPSLSKRILYKIKPPPYLSSLLRDKK